MRKMTKEKAFIVWEIQKYYVWRFPKDTMNDLSGECTCYDWFSLVGQEIETKEIQPIVKKVHSLVSLLCPNFS